MRGSGLHGIHQDERDEARLGAAVGPGVVGNLLYDGAARPQQDLVLVHHLPDPRAKTRLEGSSPDASLPYGVFSFLLRRKKTTLQPGGVRRK